MTLLDRRSALKSILLAGVAPFYVPVERLMRIKPIVVPDQRLMVSTVLRKSDGGVVTFRYAIEPLERDHSLPSSEIQALLDKYPMVVEFFPEDMTEQAKKTAAHMRAWHMDRVGLS